MNPGTFGRTIAWMAFAILLCASLLIATGQEKKLTKADLPAPVLASFEKAYPHATINGVSKETEHGKTYYEIESLDGKTKRDVLYTADGKVEETEETIDAAKLPSSIKNTISKEYPKGKIVKAETSTKASTMNYEVHVKDGEKTREIKFDSKGKMIKSSKDEDEMKEKEKKDKKDEKDEEEDDDDDDDNG